MSFMTYFASFFFKERAIITPVFFLLFIFFYNLSGGQIKIKFNGAILLFLVMLLVCSVIFGLFTIKVNYNQNDISPPILNYPLSQRILLTSYCFSFYFYSLVVPFNLHYYYFFPFDPIGKIPAIVFLSGIGAILVAVFYYWLYKKSKYFNPHCRLIFFKC